MVLAIDSTHNSNEPTFVEHKPPSIFVDSIEQTQPLCDLFDELTESKDVNRILRIMESSAPYGCSQWE